jgi:predicted transcriptional regulator
MRRTIKGRAMTETLTISIELAADIASKLEDLAADARLSPGDLAADLLARSIEAEGAEIALIEARLAEAEAGGPFVPHAEARRWLTSLGTKTPLSRPLGVRR